MLKLVLEHERSVNSKAKSCSIGRKKTLSALQKAISLLVIYVFCFVSCVRNMALDMRIKLNVLVLEIYIRSANFPHAELL